MKRPSLHSAVAVTAVILLTACSTESTKPGESGDPRALQVSAGDDKCEVSAAEAPAGKISFAVTNDGSKVNEFYLLAADGLRIIGEVEGIGAKANKTLTVMVPEGEYVTACKPGMVGKGIRGEFKVTKSDESAQVSGSDQELVKQAERNYRSYVNDQSAQLLEKTKQFVRLYKDGKDDESRKLYPDARTHWERIETVAESFGDLDPKMDAREADVDFDGGEKWTGWHVIEKDLWPQRAKDYKAFNDKQRAKYADDLLKNTADLDKRVQATGKDAISYPIDKIANGSRGLLEEVATGKVTGEEEYWSRTDLWDFQANVDGARVAFEGVEPLLETKDAALAKDLRKKFTALTDLLDKHRKGEGFELYSELSKAEIRKLAAAVDALSEPLSKLTGAVLS